jgi:cytochrome c556
MYKRFSAAAVAAFSVCLVCIAQDADVSVVVEGRQSNLRDLGAAFKAIGDELKKSSPAMPYMRQYARQINDFAQQQHFWFPAGSGPQPDIKTHAKSEIWSQPAQFSQAQTDFSREAARLVEVLASNDVAAVKTQYRVVGKTCEGCHKVFREKIDD